MKTIKIFLASSEELKNDRVSFGNFIRELDKRYQQRGIRIDLYTWEGADGAYNGRRKQDEYNENVRDSDMLVALFYIKAGGFTQEEFHEAVKSFSETGRPKVYIYFRQLEDESKVSDELKKFKEELEGQDARGHFAFRYNNDDSLHLDFIMQLLMQEKIQKDELDIEDGQVLLNGMVIAQMDSLQFATDNKGNQDLMKDLHKIESELNEIQQALDQNPNIEFIKKQYELKKEEYTKKKVELKKHQKNLLNTAIRIANLQKNHINEEIKRAIDAFNSGDAPRADFILDETEHNTQQIKEQLRAAKAVAYEKIDQLLLHASFKISNTNIQIESRINQAKEYYEDAISLAKESAIDNTKYFKILIDYSSFLYEYGYYSIALEYTKIAIDLIDCIKGDSVETINSYLIMSEVLYKNSIYSEARECRDKAISLAIKQKESDSLLMARVFEELLRRAHSDDFDLYQKAFSFYKRANMYDNHGLAKAYMIMGNYYFEKRFNYSLPLRFYKKSQSYLENLGDEESRLMLSELHYKMALEYQLLNDVEKTISYLLKALEECHICHHNDYLETTILIELTNTYRYLGNFEKAYEYLTNALNIENIIGKNHPYMNRIHHWIGKSRLWGNQVLSNKRYHDWLFFISEKGNPIGEYYLAELYENPKWYDYFEQNSDKAVYYYTQSANHGYAIAQNKLGEFYLYGKNVKLNLSEAKKLFMAAAEQGLVDDQLNLADIFYDESDYRNSFIWYKKAAEQGNAIAQYNIGVLYDNGDGVDQDYSQAIKWYKKAAEYHQYAEALNRLGEMCEEGLGTDQDYNKAFKYYEKATSLILKKQSDVAIVHLGLLYEKGLGVEKDIEEAYTYYEWAASNGNPFAIGKIGYSYLNGIYYKKNPKRGLKLLFKAAWKDDIKAIKYLGKLYALGHIVIKNDETANEWINKLTDEKKGEVYNDIAWDLYEKEKYDEALPWAEKAIAIFPNDPNVVDTLSSIYQSLKRYDEALEQFELCLKLYKEQENSEGINRTEAKIAELIELMKNGGVSEQ